MRLTVRIEMMPPKFVGLEMSLGIFLNMSKLRTLLSKLMLLLDNNKDQI